MESKGRQRIRIGRRTRKRNREELGVVWMGKKSDEKSSEEVGWCTAQIPKPIFWTHKIEKS